MTSYRDPEQILAAWLDEGPTDLPSATRRAILTALPTTPQARRGPLAPWRPSRMPSITRAIAGLALVAIAAVTSLYLLHAGPSTGGPATSPTPAPSGASSPGASPAARASAGSSPAALPTPAIPHGPLAGTYTSSVFTPATTFTVRSGWANEHEATDELVLWMGDPLHELIVARIVGDPLVYPRHNPLYTIGAPTSTTLAGLPAQEIVLALSSDANKANGFFPLAPLPESEGGTLDIRNPGTTCRLFVVQVHGVQVVVLSQRPTDESSPFDAQVDAILASMQFR